MFDEYLYKDEDDDPENEEPTAIISQEDLD